MTDPFVAPGVIPSTFPTISSLRGRLVLIKPLRQTTVPNRMNPGTMQEQITANVSVVDGMGPVPAMKGNPAQPTGQMIEGPDWNGMWINSEVIVKQLADALAIGGMVLGRIQVPNPQAHPGKGNAYGLVDPTEEDKQIARNFLANRTVNATSGPAPAPAQPQAQQQQQYAQPQAQAAPPAAQPQMFTQPAQPVYTPPPAAPAPTAPQPTGYVPGANPFAAPAAQ